MIEKIVLSMITAGLAKFTRLTSSRTDSSPLLSPCGKTSPIVAPAKPSLHCIKNVVVMGDSRFLIDGFIYRFEEIVVYELPCGKLLILPQHWGEALGSKFLFTQFFCFSFLNIWQGVWSPLTSHFTDVSGRCEC